MLFGDRRSTLNVAADILRIGGSKTAIMYGGNLSYTQTKRYLGALTEQGLLEMVDTSNGRQEYHSTDKGRKFLHLVDTLEELVGVSSVELAGVSRPKPTSHDERRQFPLVIKPYLIPEGRASISQPI